MTASPKKNIRSHKKRDNSPDPPGALARSDDGHEMGLLRSQGKVIKTHTHNSSDLLGLGSTWSCWTRLSQGKDTWELQGRSSLRACKAFGGILGLDPGTRQAGKATALDNQATDYCHLNKLYTI